MKGLALAASLAMLLNSTTGFAQAPPAPPPARPAQAAPPAAPRPAQPPPAAQAPAPPLQPAAPFPPGAKLALVNLQAIAQFSVEGKAATAKIQALVQKKQMEGTAKTKALQDNQAKLEQGGALMNETARLALQKEIERQTVEGQRFEQDAQAEITELQAELQTEFQRRLFPILQEIAKEKDLHMLLSAQESGAIWAEPGIDLTTDAIKRLDAAASKPTAAAPPAAPPAAAPPAAPKP